MEEETKTNVCARVDENVHIALKKLCIDLRVSQQKYLYDLILEDFLKRGVEVKNK